jgi:hydrogenase expression/formation protein HypC
MCLALPARVIDIDASSASSQGTVDMGGVRKQVSFALLDQVKPGDYVIVHVGYALTLMDEAEAQQTLALFAQMGEQMGEQMGGAAP